MVLDVTNNIKWIEIVLLDVEACRDLTILL